MRQYQVIDTKNKVVFIGTTDEIVDEFEIELDRRLEYGLLLEIKEDLEDQLTLVLSSTNVLPHGVIIEMISTHVPTMPLVDSPFAIPSETLFALLGVAKLEACY